MKIERRTVGTVDVCAPQDALVDEASEEFKQVLQGCLRGANPRMVVDMNEVVYVDSAALEALAGVADELGERGVQLKLAGVTPTCREILELTGLSGRYQFFEDVDAAVRSYL